MQASDIKELTNIVTNLKWDIVGFIAKKHNCLDWSEATLKDKEDQKLLNVILGIDDAIEYKDEFQSGNFEFDRFYAKFERRLTLLKKSSFKSIRELENFKEYLKEKYKK